MTLGKLARITQEGFLRLDQRADIFEQRMERMEQGFKGVLELLDAMRAELAYVRNSTKNLHLLDRDVEDLKHRVLRLERRSGLGRANP